MTRGHGSGSARPHLWSMHHAATTALADLEAIGLRVPRPSGGFFLWAVLPEEAVDESELSRRAAAQGIFLAPGSVFSPEREVRRSAMRINVAHASNPRFLTFMERAVNGQP